MVTRTTAHDDPESRLALGPADGTFGPGEVEGLPEPAARYLGAALAPGAPLARAARIRMRGQIRLGSRWVPFRAREVLAPHEGFCWAARAGWLISGSDRYLDGRGNLRWRLLRLFTVAHGDGEDVDRSAAARAAAEAVWLPSALLPRFGVRWDSTGDDTATASFRIDDHDLTIRLEMDDEGVLRAVSLDRWGDPDRSGAFGTYPFGMVVTRTASFGDITVPAAGRVGWHHGTDRWSEGEFFRFEISDLQPVT